MVGSDEPLPGGMVAGPVRVGSTVHRRAGPATPAVHRLLTHLREHGVETVPRPLGFDGVGAEVLSYVEGRAGIPPVDPVIATDAALVDVARTLRQVHDASTGFRAQTWNLSHADPGGPGEVWCHNDFAAYDLVYQGERVVGVIDWDLAAPGRRVWDVAYAAWRLVPLHRPGYLEAIGWPEPDDRGRRLRSFVDAYGLGGVDRAILLDVVAQRQALHREQMVALCAERGEEVWSVDHPHGEAGDEPYLRQHRAAWQAALDASADVSQTTPDDGGRPTPGIPPTDQYGGVSPGNIG